MSGMGVSYIVRLTDDEWLELLLIIQTTRDLEGNNSMERNTL